MKNYFASLGLMLAVVGSLTSCRETSKLPEPAHESVPLIIPEINSAKSYFPLIPSRNSINTATANNIARPVFEFVVNPSQGYTELQTVEVYKTFNRGAIYGPRVKIADLTSFPATISINSQDALTGLFLASPTTAVPSPTPVLAPAASPGRNNSIIGQDAIVFTFEYVMKDGRRIVLTPVSTVEGSVGALLPSSQINAPLAAIAVFR